MELQSVCFGFRVPKFSHRFSYQPSRKLTLISNDQNLKAPVSNIIRRRGNVGLGDASKWYLRLWRMSRWGIIACASGSDQNYCLNHTGTEREKSGVTLVEESTLKSAPLQEGKGSFLWVLGPIALISSLILPEFFSYAIEAFFKDETLAPYLQFSPKRWGLITGLRGYLSSYLVATGLKVVTPLVAAFVTWPVFGFELCFENRTGSAGCAAQHVLETILDKCQSSCWPRVPIIFEIVSVDQSYSIHSELHVLDERLPKKPGDVQVRRCNCWDGGNFPSPSCGLPLVVDDISFSNGFVLLDRLKRTIDDCKGGI
ncbi:hypothetical protein F3Y22_tig00110017pilonHSYRG00088 [Hibiscus syriacus]|uniref:Uncharacterized protein n=1 Tax=Hibiscus syriacus TaxID=106335 RepID=A0A6A3BTA8_HIBSY|nr:hypothetical protein F3Y22_tig00110017pilonHSYRG00088 [Hibiscus syriacus]